MKRREVENFHHGRVTIRPKAMTGENKRSIRDHEFSNGRVLSRHDNEFWNWQNNAIYDYEDRVKLPANRRGKL